MVAWIINNECPDVKSIVTVPFPPVKWFVKAEWRVEATTAYFTTSTGSVTMSRQRDIKQHNSPFYTLHPTFRDQFGTNDFIKWTLKYPDNPQLK